MFTTTKDILFFTLAVAVAVLTFFLAWSLYYVTMMLKKAHEVAKEVETLVITVRDRVRQIEEVINTIQEKINSSVSYLPLVVKGVTELVEHFKKRKQSKKAKSS